MKLGFLTAPFPATTLLDVADWGASAGFEVLEIACWPKSGGPARRYAGTSHIDVANLSAPGVWRSRASASIPTLCTRIPPTASRSSAT
jgi:hypothetical protein